MATREEIRKGIKRILKGHQLQPGDSNYSSFIDILDASDFPNVIDEIFKVEDKLGVVIKVERELPLVSQAEIAPMYDKVFHEGINAGQHSMIEAGYVAIESLLEGKGSIPERSKYR